MLAGEGTVLLIDDEKIVTEVGEQILELMGYRVFTAMSGQEGVELFGRMHGDISLVILDMIMPGMGGVETFQRLKEIDPKVRVLLSSGYSGDRQVSELLSQGCRGFIQKPYRLQTLSAKLQEVLAPTT